MHIILFVITIIQIVIFVVKKIFEIYGIISTDIMPALICFRPAGGQLPWRIMFAPLERFIHRRYHVWRTWHYNSIT